jgi:hypothetical protein
MRKPKTIGVGYELKHELLPAVERVRESRHDWWAVPERGLKGTARPSTRPGNESSPVRHGLSLP